MSTTRAVKWAESLLENPISLGDEYGNLVLSLGISQQQTTTASQRPSEIDCLSRSSQDDGLKVPGHCCIGSPPHDNPASEPKSGSRKACSTCHERKVQCDVSQLGSPCTNCRKASLECTLHERRRRRADVELRQTGTSSLLEGTATTSSQSAEVVPDKVRKPQRSDTRTMHTNSSTLAL